ncbi:MAG: succinate dehydrogenase cytochrome b subunit [Gemmataceae bacterium]|nr:succinate dehydrogenase cytochrome b subunit [Gemmataceae bacterium]
MNPLIRPFRTSVGSKYLVALTGLALTLFVIAHLAGNLLVFAGKDAINSYARKLEDLGTLLWAARAVLLVLFLLHVFVSLRLTMANSAARGTRYHHEGVLQASWASRHMWLTGLVLLAFILFHLAHYTFGVVVPAKVQVDESGKERKLDPPKNYLDLIEEKILSAEGKRWEIRPEKNFSAIAHPTENQRRDVYSMMVNGFRTPWISITYLVSMAFLMLHLWHGGSSMFQSLGIPRKGLAGLVEWIGPVLGVALALGNVAIVLGVWLGAVK